MRAGESKSAEETEEARKDQQRHRQTKGKPSKSTNRTTGPSGNQTGRGAGTAEEDRAEKAAPITLE